MLLCWGHVHAWIRIGDLFVIKDALCSSMPETPILMSTGPFPRTICSYGIVSLRRVKFSSICREIRLKLADRLGLDDVSEKVKDYLE